MKEKSDIFTQSSTVIKHKQNFRGLENKEKKILIIKNGQKHLRHIKITRSRLHEALLDHRKKTHILQIVSILILLILNMVFSLLNFFSFFSSLEIYL